MRSVFNTQSDEVVNKKFRINLFNTLTKGKRMRERAMPRPNALMIKHHR